MRKRTLGLVGVAAVAVIAWTLIAPGASGAGISYINLAAPTFTPVPKSVHNGGTGSQACPAPVAPDVGAENRGDLDNTTGSFLAFVRLADGQTVTQFSLLANDNDADAVNDGTAYLIRKRITDGLTPSKGGYSVMAQASTSGAVLDTLRHFTDTTINNALVDNSRYMYYAELVNCSKFVEPFGVQVVSSS